jgi:maltose phosphorylase
MRVVNNEISFNPTLPEQWKAYSFNVLFRGKVVNVRIDKEGVIITEK